MAESQSTHFPATFDSIEDAWQAVIGDREKRHDAIREYVAKIDELFVLDDDDRNILWPHAGEWYANSVPLRAVELACIEHFPDDYTSVVADVALMIAEARNLACHGRNHDFVCPDCGAYPAGNWSDD